MCTTSYTVVRISERVLAYDAIYDRVVAACVEAVKTIRTGAPLNPATGTWATCFDMGCLTTPPQLETIQALVDDAIAHGATLLLGGARSKRGGDTLFYPPTVLSGVTSVMRIAQEEVFGPVLSIMRVPGASASRLCFVFYEILVSFIIMHLHATCNMLL